MFSRYTALAALTVASLVACDSGTHYSMSDTDQGAYRTSCWNGRCREELTAPNGSRPDPACAAGERASFVMAGAYIVSACHACYASDGRVSRTDLTRCRALRCDHPQDCPPFHRGHPVACREGLCVEKDGLSGASADRPLDRVSAAALCMAGAGPASADRIALAQDRLSFAQRACDAQGRCAQPVGCRTIPR